MTENKVGSRLRLDLYKTYNSSGVIELRYQLTISIVIQSSTTFNLNIDGFCRWSKNNARLPANNTTQLITWGFTKSKSYFRVTIVGIKGWTYNFPPFCDVLVTAHDGFKFRETDNASISYRVLLTGGNVEIPINLRQTYGSQVSLGSRFRRAKSYSINNWNHTTFWSLKLKLGY